MCVYMRPVIDRTKRFLSLGLILALFIPPLLPSLRASKLDVAVVEQPRKRLNPEKRAREAWLWHELTRQRLEVTHSLDAVATSPAFIATDTSDISVIQGDNSLIAPANPFDLNGRTVQFMPAGSSYTITSSVAAFDTNLGTKLNFVLPPAVNPKPDTDPGDDAYILQDLNFTFPFYGMSFTSVGVSSNGNLVFRPAGVSQQLFDDGAVDSGESLTGLQTGLPRIAPYWHDLDARASVTQGQNGIFLRRDTNRVLITWNNIRDFPNDPAVDRGVHRFQVSISSDGRIAFTYDTVQLTTMALAGITPGTSSSVPTLVDLSNPTSAAVSSPIAEFFTVSTVVDYAGVIAAFYAAHPSRDVYDFIYLVTDFDFDLGGAFAFYLPVRNEIRGIGQDVFDFDPGGTVGSRKIQGLLNLANIMTAYPDSPVTRFIGANHALSVMGQEQGHRWLAYVNYPGAVPNLLLGRDDAHWSFYFNIEATLSSPAARRSSSMEGNVWRDNSDGSFTSVNLIDGYSKLDHYIMGLRPPNDVPGTFVITNSNSFSSATGPRPNATILGTRQNVTIDQILQANQARDPSSSVAPKNFRAAVVLLVKQGLTPSPATISKITRYRLAWESYFAQSTDYLGTMNTGLADDNGSRILAAASAASYASTMSPAEIGAVFGSGLTNGHTEVAASQPLPLILDGTQVFLNGTPAPLFFASSGQINFEIPRTTSATTFSPASLSATALIEVVRNGELIRAGTFQIAPVVPAIFTLNQTGTGAAAAIDAFTGTLEPFNAKQANGQPNIIAAFATGFGADATDVDGDVKASVQATIDGIPATVLYAGRAPGFTGLNQLNIVFPANIAAGTHTLAVSRNGISTNLVTIATR